MMKINHGMKEAKAKAERWASRLSHWVGILVVSGNGESGHSLYVF